MNLTERMNKWTDEFCESAAEILLEDNKPTIGREKVADILGVSKDQVKNAVWNGTLNIGYGFHEDNAKNKFCTFPKAAVWRFLTGYMPKCMREQ